MRRTMLFVGAVAVAVVALAVAVARVVLGIRPRGRHRRGRRWPVEHAIDAVDAVIHLEFFGHSFCGQLTHGFFNCRQNFFHRRNRARIGAAGRQRVLDRWTWRLCAEQTVEQYREVLAMPDNIAKLKRNGRIK